MIETKDLMRGQGGGGTKAGHYWLIVAWGLYVFSLFLPSAAVPSDGPTLFDMETLVGWRTALWCIRLSLKSVSIRQWDDALVWTLLRFWPLSNLLMLATPFLFWASRKRTVQIAAIVMGVATLANASVFLLLDQDHRALKMGYYLWVLSFAIAAIGLYRESVRFKTRPRIFVAGADIAV